MAKRNLHSLDVVHHVPTKRPRTELVPAVVNKIGTVDRRSNSKRTSNLMAPTVELSGHKDAVYGCKFSPDGVNIASGGHDKDILIWHVYGECENHTVLTGHKGAILELEWSPSNEFLYTASADATAAIWDVENGVRVKKMRDHQSFVNSISPSRNNLQLYATGSDDGTAKVFDLRIRSAIRTFDSTYQVTAVCLSTETNKIYSGGIDNTIKVWDLRQGQQPLQEYIRHRDTITSLSLSPDGSYLLSNAMDNMLFCWDTRAYIEQGGDRLRKQFTGPQHGSEKLLIKSNWSPCGRQVCCGSSDRFVYIFDFMSQRLLYKLPGHKGSVNEVAFHPKESIIVSGSSDRTLYLGEISQSPISMAMHS